LSGLLIHSVEAALLEDWDYSPPENQASTSAYALDAPERGPGPIPVSPNHNFVYATNSIFLGSLTFIRDAIRKEGMVAIGKVVFTSREHIIALEARDKGMVGTTLRFPYEVRDEKDYFDVIEDEKVSKEMLDLAIHIVNTKKGEFNPDEFQDQYEDALKELLRKKQKGEKIERVKEPSRTNVVNLMDALRKSVAEEKKPATKTKKVRKRIAGQSEMLLPIQGDKGKETAKHVTRSRAKQKKAG
jgi:DNA end-binding protein Ku